MFTRYKLGCLGLLASALLSGCAYYNFKRQFFADCHTHVPEIRTYAIEHLPSLSDVDRQIVATTEPRLAHSNFVSVHFTWPNVCEVRSGAPPDCNAHRVFDLRPSR